MGKKRPCQARWCKGTEYHTGFGDVWSCKDCTKREEGARKSQDIAGPDFIILDDECDKPVKPPFIISGPLLFFTWE